MWARVAQQSVLYVGARSSIQAKFSDGLVVLETGIFRSKIVGLVASLWDLWILAFDTIVVTTHQAPFLQVGLLNFCAASMVREVLLCDGI